MARYVVRARSDGRGGFSPFVTHPSSHAGETVYIGGREAKVSSDGRVNISAAIMRGVGVMGSDGRYRVAVETGARTDDGERSVGLFVSTPPSQAGETTSGVIIPRSEAPSTVIEPSETEDFYIG